MILGFLFKKMPLRKQVSYLQKKGIMLGTRLKGGRTIYIYMLRNLFVEVYFKDDNTNETPEKLNILRGLHTLNEYLEKEFKTTF
ncbi:hypothetical protein [Dawidia soli]|uniref:Uncharacterized protein n=1 Tax=Dawidia soli TaxID=2782352 RepID=A0AAP2GJ28_9BACT|nr:hypothetical protein [Dawidia soli]MBT1687548.1 hypothetical protein [Dawidia soli]